MLACETCGGTDFQKDAGYFYCSECQTQSQHYFEQESTVPEPESLITPSEKRKKKERKTGEKLTVADSWTSWDAFNYILYGMTQELKDLPFSPKNLEDVVLRLWACQLQKSEIAFVSRTWEKKPKLGFYYKERDLKVIYGLNKLISSKKDKGKRALSKLFKSDKKIQKEFFKKHLEECSTSQLTGIYLADNIDTLPGSSGSVPAGEAEGNFKGSLRHIFTSSDNATYMKCKDSGNINAVKSAKRMKVNFFCKSKLLEIIHLALLLVGSVIQLGDLLRFIRESHLSFAKVTQFLPEEFKLSRGDILFIETTRSKNMPTHLMQRRIGRALARSLGVNEVSLPDMHALVSRYCVELNLPEIMVQYSMNILKHVGMENMCILKRSKYLPDFEGLAVASIIFIMKLLFGLDGMTELILSDLAEKINSVSSTTDKLFVFNDWQKHIEFRKALIQNLHYPTEEKLKSNPMGSSKGYLNMIIKESKDENKEERIKKYNQYYDDPKNIKSVEEVLQFLKEPINIDCLDLPPSLTPYTSYLDIILELYREDKDNEKLKVGEIPNVSPVTLKILNETFRNKSLEFIINPKIYEERLIEGNFNIIRRKKSDLICFKLVSDAENFGFRTSWRKNVENSIKFPEFSKSNNVVFIENSFDYWILKHNSRNHTLVSEFKQRTLHKMSVNFRWLLVECSTMLEMNSRELYNQLTFIENKMKTRARRMRNSSI